jgi:hypothetical protein
MVVARVGTGMLSQQKAPEIQRLRRLELVNTGGAKGGEATGRVLQDVELLHMETGKRGGILR